MNQEKASLSGSLYFFLGLIFLSKAFSYFYKNLQTLCLDELYTF